MKKKISGKRAVRVGNWFTLFISNEDMDDIIKFVKLLEDSGLLIDDATETEKYEIRKTITCILWCYDCTYGYFIGSVNVFFVDTTCGFFIDKCYV